jgi:hypothetical protein
MEEKEKPDTTVNSIRLIFYDSWQFSAKYSATAFTIIAAPSIGKHMVIPPFSIQRAILCFYI